MKLEDIVEVRSIREFPTQFKDWTQVSRFLACGLQGVEVREIFTPWKEFEDFSGK